MVDEKAAAQTTRTAREAAAEALWQAESLRASGARRRVDWDGEGEDVHAKWLFMADAAIGAFLTAMPEDATVGDLVSEMEAADG